MWPVQKIVLETHLKNINVHELSVCFGVNKVKCT